MIYTHVLNRGGQGVFSPLDRRGGAAPPARPSARPAGWRHRSSVRGSARAQRADQTAHGSVEQWHGIEDAGASGAELAGELVQGVLAELLALAIDEQVGAL